MSAAAYLIANNPWSNSKGQNLDSKQYEIMDDIIQKVALQELREDTSTRQQCLIQFREWILQNKDIENCITDDNFLLRFLRAKKYSLYMAQQMLLKYLNLRRCFKYIFDSLDYLDPKVYEIITKGYIFASPFKDKHGRRVIITIGKKYDTTKFNSTDMARAHIITYETLIDDEETQILGVTHVGDCADIPLSVVPMWNISEFITLARWGQQSFPMRHKEIHVLHVPTPLQYVYDFAASLGSQKLQNRTRVYTSFEQLHENIDSSILPAEYGGNMAMDKMIKLWKEELAIKRDRLLSLDQITLLSDEGIIRRRSNVAQSDTGSINGSFRKLEID